MDESATEAASGDVRLSQIPTLLIIRGALLVLLAVGLVGGLHLYLANRVVRGAGLEGWPLWLGEGLFFALFLAIPGGFWAGRRGPSVLNRAALWISHVWLGLFGLLLTSVLLAELVRAGKGLATGDWSWTPWLSAASLGAALVTAGWGHVVARRVAKVRRREVAIPGLPEALRGLTVAQISDLHIGQTLDGRFLRRVVDRVNALDADLVAVTGDLVDGFVSTTRAEVASLGDLRARRGVFYVTGNHEYYYGGPAWEAEVRRLGLTVLHNEHRLLDIDGAPLAVAGVTDHDGAHFGDDHACRPELALKDLPEDVPRLLLAHQPRTALRVRDRVDLQLSGHTHGGQIFPFNFLVRLQQPVISGLRRINGVLVYTHSGTGYWGPPMRVGAAPEIALLTLVPARSA